MVGALVAFGALWYGWHWIRFRATGTFRLMPDQRPLWLLFWAAVIFTAERVIIWAW